VPVHELKQSQADGEWLFDGQNQRFWRSDTMSSLKGNAMAIDLHV
jgi:hypothetical protein